MFTTLDLIKDIINNKFIQTNKITKIYIKEKVDNNDLIPVYYEDGGKTNFVVRKKFNVFNKDNLEVNIKQVKTNDEINKLYYILMYLCENHIHNLIFGKTDTYTVHLRDFFNVKKYETTKEIKYEVYCLFLLSLWGRCWNDIYKVSFVINKDVSDLNNVLQIDELYEIKEQPPIIVNNSTYYSWNIQGFNL